MGAIRSRPLAVGARLLRMFPIRIQLQAAPQVVRRGASVASAVRLGGVVAATASLSMPRVRPGPAMDVSRRLVGKHTSIFSILGVPTHRTTRNQGGANRGSTVHRHRIRRSTRHPARHWARRPSRMSQPMEGGSPWSLPYPGMTASRMFPLRPPSRAAPSWIRHAGKSTGGRARWRGRRWSGEIVVSMPTRSPLTGKRTPYSPRHNDPVGDSHTWNIREFRIGAFGGDAGSGLRAVCLPDTRYTRGWKPWVESGCSSVSARGWKPRVESGRSSGSARGWEPRMESARSRGLRAVGNRGLKARVPLVPLAVGNRGWKPDVPGVPRAVGSGGLKAPRPGFAGPNAGGNSPHF